MSALDKLGAVWCQTAVVRPLLHCYQTEWRSKEMIKMNSDGSVIVRGDNGTVVRVSRGDWKR